MGRCIAGGYGMTKEDIIRMAREAGLAYGSDEKPLGSVTRFAALVAAAEREKVARWHIGSGYTTGHGDTIEDLLVELEWQVRESEREACAAMAEAFHHHQYDFTGNLELHEAIRARGEK
jgi:hypothetical protein